MDELARLEPVKRRRENCDSFFRAHVRAIFQIVVLSFLLSFQVESRKSSEILFAYRLVDSCSSSYSFPVVIGCVGPPISLRLNISYDHILNRSRQPRYLPRNISFPASPSLTEMLQYRLGLVCFDSIGHHVIDVHDYCGPQFEVVL